MTDINGLISKLAKEEQRFLDSQFLCPVLRGQPVRVRIAGIIMTLNVRPSDFQGWGIFKAIDHKLARWQRGPTMAEKQQYFKLFPLIRFILCREIKNAWLGFPAYQNDCRFKITGLVPIQLVEEAQVFDIICTRYDSFTFWFDELDQRRSPRSANYLRESLNILRKPNELELDGLTQEEKDAYNIAYEFVYEQSEQAKQERENDKIKIALQRAGAVYEGYIERGDTYTVEYIVDGSKHRSVIQKGSLNVVTAGICLSGGDAAFDLQSLIGVIRESVGSRHMVRMGENRQYGDDEVDW